MNRRRFVVSLGMGGVALRADTGVGVAEPAQLRSGGSQRATPTIVGSVSLTTGDPSREMARATILEARRANVSALVVPAITTASEVAAAGQLLSFRHLAEQLSDICILLSGAEHLTSRDDRQRVALVAHAHGLQWAGSRSARVADFRAGGLRLTKVCSGWRNLAADGSYEATDLGLTHFGRSAIRALNAARVVVDLASTGRKSSLEAMRLTRQPVVFTHANAAAVQPHPLNLTDDQIRACAQTGGVIGVSAFPPLVASRAVVTVADLLRHIDHIVGLVGVDHVALGLDVHPHRERRYATDPIPTEPTSYPEGIARLSDIPSFASRLAAHGYPAAAREKILGGNLARVFRQVWSGV